MAETALPASSTEKPQRARPEKPDEEKFKTEQAQAEKELAAALEKLV